MWHWNGQWLVDEVAFVKAVHLARSESTDDAIDLLTRTKRVK
jgi:hypothetical protein